MIAVWQSPAALIGSVGGAALYVALAQAGAERSNAASVPAAGDLTDFRCF